MTLDLVRILIGEVPAGYEKLEYTAALIIALFTLKIIYEMFYFVFNLINRR